jgi:hypothetical protein
MAEITYVSKTPSQIRKEVVGLDEIPNKIRFLVEAAPNLNSKIATLQKFYPSVDIAEDGNFLVQDKDGTKYQLDNKKKFTAGDLIDISKEATEVIGSIAGATAGTAVAPGAGTIVGAGAGMAGAAEIFERVGQAYGAEVLRTNKEHFAQRATDFAFGSVGQAVAPLVTKFVKGAFTGYGTKAKVANQQRLKNFIDAGVTPSLGQVTQKRGIQTVELLLGNFPGSSGVIAKTAQEAQDALGKKALNLGRNLINKALPANEVQVGRVINQGIKNGVNASDGFVGRFQSRAGVLFGELDNYVKPDDLINIGGTLDKLKGLVAPIPGAEASSVVFKNSFLDDIFKGLQKDVAKNNGALPYNAIKSLRNKIGNKLSSLDLVPDVDKAQLKLIYGALSEDLKAGAKQIGGQKALNAFTRANKFYQSGLKRIESYLEPITKVADPDRIASLLLNSAKEGATRINAIKKSLTTDQYSVFLSSVIEKMGRIRPGQALAGALDDVVEGSGKFSSETFLTNWNKLNKEAKNVLFGGTTKNGVRYGGGKGWNKEMIKDLDQLVSVSDIIRQSGKTFANPSGTADRVVGQGLLLGGGATAITGNPAYIIGLLSAFGGANVTAKLFTNPSFVKWLASSTKIAANKGIDGVTESIGKLGTIMGSADSESRQAVYEYLKALTGETKE